MSFSCNFFSPVQFLKLAKIYVPVRSGQKSVVCPYIRRLYTVLYKIPIKVWLKRATKIPKKMPINDWDFSKVHPKVRILLLALMTLQNQKYQYRHNFQIYHEAVLCQKPVLYQRPVMLLVMTPFFRSVRPLCHEYSGRTILRSNSFCNPPKNHIIDLEIFPRKR